MRCGCWNGCESRSGEGSVGSARFREDTARGASRLRWRLIEWRSPTSAAARLGPGEAGHGGYPCQGLRTHDFLYIRNFRPDRWPNGTRDYANAAVPGNWYADTDNGPTKTYMMENRDNDAEHRRLYDLSFARCPAEELYDLRKDPDQLNNVAADRPTRWSSSNWRTASPPT